MKSLRAAGQFVGIDSGSSIQTIAAVVQFVTDTTRPSLSDVIDALGRTNYTVAQSTRPLYRRTRPVPQDPEKSGRDETFIDLTNAGELHPGGPDLVADAASRFDARAAAAIGSAVGTINIDAIHFVPGGQLGGHFEPADAFANLTEIKTYPDDTPDVVIPTAQSLAVIAYPDYFPGEHDALSLKMVSEAIMVSNPGWCGTFGPGVDGAFDVAFGDPPEGNYDMSQMHLLQIAYRYYEELTPGARELLITQLLARGRIHRPRLDDTFTSEGTPDDWSRAGFVSPLGINIRIGETENHILLIITARYLTNQLLYQRTHERRYDNRRNGDVLGGPNCMDLVLSLLRNILRDDFSEYNAKPYQSETRHAILNLHSFAYDHEVRLAARMALDYVSAHMAISSNDLRRMVPFRRRNEVERSAHDDRGFMQISLLETTFGADPLVQHFAILAGNTRIYAARGMHIRTDLKEGHDAVIYALSDYRLPASIHDLLVNDAHRRFFQRLHRIPLDDVDVTGRTAEDQEVYAGSPSYLISAGGNFSTWAIDPGPVSLSSKLREKNDQQLGVAVPTSFMPTARSELDCGDPALAFDLIQFGRFSDVAGVFNYGVAPDFACGPQIHLPGWCQQAMAEDLGLRLGDFRFVNRGSNGDAPGFFLAVLQQGDFAVMEAFDTWLHPELTFEQFRLNAFQRNEALMGRGLRSGIRDQYVTTNGNTILFVISDDAGQYGAWVEGVIFAGGPDSAVDGFGDASRMIPERLANGSVMNSDGHDGFVRINNHFLNTAITLDMRDQRRPTRGSDTGEVERAGPGSLVWVDYAWTGPSEGDFFRPFNTMAAAVSALAQGGRIRLKAGVSRRRFAGLREALHGRARATRSGAGPQSIEK